MWSNVPASTPTAHAGSTAMERSSEPRPWKWKLCPERSKSCVLGVEIQTTQLFAGCKRRTRIGDLCGFVFLPDRMAVQKCVEVRSELLQLIPTDVIPLVDGPANEQASD